MKCRFNVGDMIRLNHAVNVIVDRENSGEMEIEWFAVGKVLKVIDITTVTSGENRMCVGESSIFDAEEVPESWCETV